MGWINDLEAERDALRQKLADSQADYLRRHKDACDRAMEVVELRQQLAEAREALNAADTALRMQSDCITWFEEISAGMHPASFEKAEGAAVAAIQKIAALRGDKKQESGGGNG